MRDLFFLLIMIVISQQCVAQTDSTKIKLDQYQKWHDAGIISDGEYSQVKAKLLNIVLPKQEEPKEAKASPIELSKLQEKYKAQITGGSVLFSVGIAGIVGGAMYFTYAQPTISNRKTNAIVICSFGGASAIDGSIILATGLKNRALYRSEKGNLSLNVGLNQLGVTYNF